METGLDDIPCSICGNTVPESVQCDACLQWWCINCVNRHTGDSLPDSLYEALRTLGRPFPWDCANCSPLTLPQHLLLGGVFTRDELLTTYRCGPATLQVSLRSTPASSPQVPLENEEVAVSPATEELAQALGALPPTLNFQPESLSDPMRAMFNLPTTPLAQAQSPPPSQSNVMQALLTLLDRQEAQRRQDERQRREDMQRLENQRRVDMENMRLLFQQLGTNGATTIEHQSRAQGGDDDQVRTSSSLLTSQLPKLQLPSFSGDALEWPGFWDSFDVNIHSRANLRDKQKMDYLIQCLKGPARDKVKGLGSQGDRYPEAVRILHKAYGDENDIKMANWKALGSIPHVKENLSNLEKFVDDVRALSFSLIRLGVDQAAIDGYVPLLLDKLPSELYKNAAQIAMLKDRHITSWSITEFIDTLTHIFKSRVKESNTKRFKKNSTDDSESLALGPAKTGAGTPPTVAFLQASSARQSSSSTKNRLLCVFCGGSNHYSDSCKKVADISQRIELAKKGNHCFKCLGKNHTARTCRRRKPCYYCKAATHNSAFCRQRQATEATAASIQHLADQEEAEFQSSLDPQTAEGMLQVHLAGSNEKDGIVMSSFSCTVANPKTKSVKTLQVYLDSGARFSCINKEAAQRLGLQPVKHVVLETARFNSHTTEKVSADVVQLYLLGPCGFKMPMYVYSVKDMAPTLPIYPIDFDAKTLSYVRQLKPLNLPPLKETKVPIDLLVGMDYWHQVMGPQAVTKALPVGPSMAVYYTPVGVILSGNYVSESRHKRPIPTRKSHCLFIDGREAEKEKYDIQRFWDLESVGLLQTNQTAITSVYESFKKTVIQEGDRYYVRWPWKAENPEIASNYNVATRRLCSTLKLLAPNVTDTKNLEAYNDIIIDQLNKKIVEPVLPTTPTGPLIHYIPHFPVIRTDRRTTKIRIVYDASAKTPNNGPSLNDLIHVGNNYLQDLVGLLLRFRKSKVALTSDIEKAFLQVGLQEIDRDSVRFLWLKNISNPRVDGNIQVYRFARIPFGVVASPYLLGATIHHHLDLNPGKLADQICSNIYMDNIFLGANDTGDAYKCYQEAKVLFAKASMNLREWSSNDQSFMNLLQEKDKVADDEVKVLGLVWNTKQDTISSKLVSPYSGVITKRGILRHLAKLFDPLGILSPISIRGKILLQQLWKEQFRWDDELPERHANTWADTAACISQAHAIKLPRNVNIESSSLYQLVCFADASPVAYAAVVYVCQTEPKPGSHLLFGKARVAPVKPTLTLPRLELLAMLLGVRILNFVKSQFQCQTTSSYLFTDSEIALHWVSCSKSLEPYIAHRVAEIRGTKNVQFGHIPSEHNPADLATRGLTSKDMIKKLHPLSCWFCGPRWILKDPNEWPVKFFKRSAAAVALLIHSPPNQLPERPFPVNSTSPFGIFPESFSDLKKLLRVSAYCQRFVLRCKKKNVPSTTVITPQELSAAMKLWILDTQKQFTQHVIALRKKKSTTLINQLDLFESEGILRCGGRLANAPLDPDAKFPILMPKDHYITKLITLEAHKSVHHFGAKATLTRIRSTYWIPQGLSYVKKVIRKCAICLRAEGGSLRPPKMAPLPKERLSTAPAFTFTGLDYLGPLYVKSKKGDPFQKRWICIFTCFSTRAVHLELVCNCTADSALNAVKRFISRRGSPTVLLSDNAKQFARASDAIGEIWEKGIKSAAVAKLETFFATRQITWKFLPEKSPWYGGFYERLIGLIKKALRKVLWKTRLDDDALRTLACEVEGTLNCRPLLSLSDNLKDESVLTPANFIAPSTRLGLPPSESFEKDPDYQPPHISKKALLAYFTVIQKKANQFWKLWSTQYLQELRQVHVTYFKHHKGEKEQNPVINQVYLLRGESPRNTWKLGKVVEFLPSNDGLVRFVKVQFCNGNVSRRAVKDLFPLELETSESSSVTRGPEDVEN